MGVFEAVPYFGPIPSSVPAFLFAMGEGGMAPLWVLGADLAVLVLENNVICTCA
jgi:predicted PurR-regulated permease PerM